MGTHAIVDAGLGSHGTSERLPVRVIEYLLEPHETEEDTIEEGDNDASVCRLVTTLIDPDAAPAHELASLYRERWAIETAFDELKTHQRGPGVVLRSKTPEGVMQEAYGLLLTRASGTGQSPRHQTQDEQLARQTPPSPRHERTATSRGAFILSQQY